MPATISLPATDPAVLDAIDAYRIAREARIHLTAELEKARRAEAAAAEAVAEAVRPVTSSDGRVSLFLPEVGGGSMLSGSTKTCTIEGIGWSVEPLPRMPAASGDGASGAPPEPGA